MDKKSDNGAVEENDSPTLRSLFHDLKLKRYRVSDLMMEMEPGPSGSRGSSGSSPVEKKPRQNDHLGSDAESMNSSSNGSFQSGRGHRMTQEQLNEVIDTVSHFEKSFPELRGSPGSLVPGRMPAPRARGFTGRGVPGRPGAMHNNAFCLRAQQGKYVRNILKNKASAAQNKTDVQSDAERAYWAQRHAQDTAVIAQKELQTKAQPGAGKPASVYIGQGQFENFAKEIQKEAQKEKEVSTRPGDDIATLENLLVPHDTQVIASLIICTNVNKFLLRTNETVKTEVNLLKSIT
jgi:hypothetical protein